MVNETSKLMKRDLARILLTRRFLEKFDCLVSISDKRGTGFVLVNDISLKRYGLNEIRKGRLLSYTCGKHAKVSENGTSIQVVKIGNDRNSL